MDDTYQEVNDPAITVKFVLGSEEELRDKKIIVTKDNKIISNLVKKFRNIEVINKNSNFNSDFTL